MPLEGDFLFKFGNNAPLLFLHFLLMIKVLREKKALSFNSSIEISFLDAATSSCFEQQFYQVYSSF